MITEDLICSIENYLQTILQENGTILYSSVQTLTRGDIYVMGLNPGGEDSETIQQALADLPFRNKNAYIDEHWGDKVSRQFNLGLHPLQKNITGLLSTIGYDPKNVFSTNLIFTKSRSQSGAQYPERAELCWPVHQQFIKIVDPKCFIVFGVSKTSPFQYLKDRYGLALDLPQKSGHGQWNCFLGVGEIEGKQWKVIGLPHLSRYCIRNHQNVMNWIKTEVNLGGIESYNLKKLQPG